MEPLKIGIVGTGMAWEKLHWPAYQRLRDHFNIVAVCDRDIDKARRAAGEIGLSGDRAFNSYQKMLNTVDLEAVDIMVPIDQTFEVSKDIISHNKHIILEKPVAASLSGAKELIKLGKKLKIMIAENYRYDEENKIIKNLIDDRAIGNVAYFIDNNVQEFQQKMLSGDFASTEWRQHPDFRGGIFLDSAVHHIARHRFLFGSVESVYATGRSTSAEFCPYSSINAMLRFGDQITGHYAFFCIAKETQAPIVGLRIFGTEGEIYLEGKNCGYVNYSRKDGEHQAISYKPNEGYFNELLNFYEAVKNDTSIVATPDKGLGDMQVIFDILRSIETGSVINSGASTGRRRPAVRKEAI
ncbi:MAG: Gfo/Idh/MocA family oxidoreductase [Clostridiales bacterium]|jgi:predicted dehydrogenase|nr:Gfo/Idh/MocA family oxidoreductase [Clostridiales bacterium]